MMPATQKGKNAFTLIEMAVVLIIVGLLVGLIAPLVTDFIRHDKKVQARDFVKEVKDRIIGYALINKRLPAEATWKSDIGVGVDPYGEELVYIVDSALTSGDMCEKSPSDNIEIVKDISATESETHQDIAFIVYSTGRNVGAEINIAGRPDIRTADPRYYTTWPSSPGNTDEWDDIIEFATFPYLRNKVCTNTNNQSFTPQGSNVSFGQNIASFDDAAVSNPPGQDFGGITVNADGTVSLGAGVKNAANNGRGCLWYQGDNTDGNCADGACEFNFGFRAYFTFKFATADTSVDSKDQASGFTFAAIDADQNTSEACGGTTAPRYLGYGDDLTTQINPYKFAGEIDIYPNPGTGYPGQLNDPAGNHNDVALIWWNTSLAGGDREYDNAHADMMPVGYTYQANQHEGARNAEPNDGDVNDGRAVYFDSSNVTWLEDAQEHTFRIEVYRNATNGALPGGGADGDDMLNATIWIDCTVDCSDLTVPYEGGADAVITQNVTVADNATSTGIASGGFQKFRFGWTEATSSTGYAGTAQDVTISDFGIRFLKEEPEHLF